MRNLFAFLYRHHVFFVFILLEIVAFGILIQSHHYQGSRFASSAQAWSGKVLEYFENSVDYFSLKKINHLLAEENAQLRNRISTSPISHKKNNALPHQYISAKVIKSSYNKRNNYLTLNKGRLNGIEKGMGVCVNEGVVGIVRDVTDNYATVMSVLNKHAVISSRFTKSNHFGEIVWDGKSHHFAQLRSVEKYVDVSIGDTLTTNSFSSIFPEGILLGTVNRFERDDSENFYKIEIDLSVDYSNIDYVYVIKNLHGKERLELESKLKEND
ncbi:MAG: rod shape-determining protein MreC [Flavobacteriales bacterium]|nr:rod shape-determining protein MreC [Flavobacteriales bacterium]